MVLPQSWSTVTGPSRANQRQLKLSIIHPTCKLKIFEGRKDSMSTTTNTPTANKCAHPDCSCPVGPNQQYCSDACEKAPDRGLAATECNCNHQSCCLKQLIHADLSIFVLRAHISA